MSLTPIAIAGPTACGKSALALHLAETLGGEIVSVDSMQVYRGLDIGTAKPTAAERQRVPHHLIDVVGLTEPFDAAMFARMARDAIADILERGRVPILCGGTGFYFSALTGGLGKAPPADAALRALLESTPLNDLLGELESKDPETFAVVDRQNPRRVVRAVEVIRLTGRKYSELRAEWGDTHAVRPDWHWIGLHRASEDLHERISRRVDQMFAGGLVAETERLRPEGLEQNKTAMQAIGYRQVVEYLRGIRSLAETAELVKLRTRQFAKRQMTWFRKYLPLNWIEIEPSESLKDLSNRVKPSQSPSSS